MESSGNKIRVHSYNTVYAIIKKHVLLLKYIYFMIC